MTGLPLTLAILLAPAPVAEQNEPRAIEAVLDLWSRGWETKDAVLAASGYSEDCDWTNAFGFYHKGRSAIAGYLGEVFAMPFVTGAKSRVASQEIRLLSDKVALVRTTVEREGQTTPDGKPLGLRQTHHLRVLMKSGDRWEIVSHLISDARDTAQPRH